MADRPATMVSPETVCFIIVKAREYMGKDVVTIPDPGSNASDDAMSSVLEDHTDDPSQVELADIIDSLNDDEKIDLVALAWLGRGDDTADNWERLRTEALTARHTTSTAEYLMGMPMLPDYLEEGLAQFGLSCTDYEARHL
ncbi:DUF3775 domain-containing protein [Pedomonas mirosovicensis]|uniref:DUF3775 domain-containing protein n=1 Tax=Pedomonas mirosovicensis TaxID=2908641 RepID=UPI0021672110|nr:DUF3775 domain-containing protein [Pedomonas mirosovicensis]MCH8685704.1 DUF3775 domain-containing protein [Pedomonas mirosovicensis]